jgi:hypothetical protein
LLPVLACSMFGIRAKFLLALLGVSLLALLSAQLSWSLHGAKQEAVFIPVSEGLVHCSGSQQQFDLLRLKQTGTRRILIFHTDSTAALAAELATLLRKSVNDPRLTASWKWSMNWQRLYNSADGSCLLFKRPGKLIVPDSKRSDQDYCEGWVTCNAAPGTKLRLICRPSTEDATIIHGQANLFTEYHLTAGQWQLLEWDAGGETRLTFRSSLSPEIGVLAVEPPNGVSVWQLPTPQCPGNSLRNQAVLLAPALVIALGQSTETTNQLHNLRALFPHSALLCCTTSEPGRFAPMHQQQTKYSAAMLLFPPQTTTNYRAACMARLINHIPGLQP